MKVREKSVTLRDASVVYLRSPTRDDAAALLAFVRQLTRESSRNLSHPAGYFDAMTVEQEAGFLDSLVRHPRGFMITAWLDDVAIGNASITPSPTTYGAHTAELGIGVLEAHQRKGLARALMEHLVEESTRIGVTNLMLRVRAFNAPAIELYQTLGFRHVGTLQGFALIEGELFDEHLYQRIAGG